MFRSAIICVFAFQSAVLHAQSMLVEDYRFGDFQSAQALSTDRFGHVFISDAGRSVVRKYAINGDLLAEVGGPGWGIGRFDNPRGLDASVSLSVFVADMHNRRIVRLDRDLNVIAALGGESDAVSVDVGYPIDVASSAFDQLFVLDSENTRILALSDFDRVTYVFGDHTSGEGRLRTPVALAFDGNERLYVLETARVVVFDIFGNFLFTFGSGLFGDAVGIGASKDRVAVVTADTVLQFSSTGESLSIHPREMMVLAESTGVFRDVAYTKFLLLLLTDLSCIIIPDN